MQYVKTVKTCLKIPQSWKCKSCLSCGQVGLVGGSMLPVRSEKTMSILFLASTLEINQRAAQLIHSDGYLGLKRRHCRKPLPNARSCYGGFLKWGIAKNHWCHLVSIRKLSNSGWYGVLQCSFATRRVADKTSSTFTDAACVQAYQWNRYLNNCKELTFQHWENTSSTIWLFNIAMEHGPFIDGLPS